MPLDNFAFVLFKPKSPGNVGAAARALKNMGCRDLRIVEPAGFNIGDVNRGICTSQVPGYVDAKMMAVHGGDILDAATIYPRLEAALDDRSLVVGTTARTGPYRSEARSIREISQEL